jgi:hypothetical protein
MESTWGNRKRIQDVRCPATGGLPDDIVYMLHHSFVGVLQMRRSIENADLLVDASLRCIHEAKCLLSRLEDNNF